MPKHSLRRYQPRLEHLEDRLAPASYTWDSGPLGVLSVSLGTGESVTVRNNAGTRSLALSTGTFTQVGGDTATGSGSAILSFAAVNNIDGSVSVNNVGAGAGTNNVTFSGIGSTDSLTSATISVAITAASTIGTIAFTGGFDISATTAIGLTTLRNITVGNGSVLSTSGSGSITLSANQQATPTTGIFVGIDVNGGAISTTGTGNILLQGRGGNAGPFKHGILVQNGGRVESTASGPTAGTVTLDGTGGNAESNNVGVVISGGSTLVTSVAGDILVKGKGADTSSSNYGVELLSGGRVSSTGAARVTLDGTGGNGTGLNYGVLLTGANTLVTSVTGDILVKGKGGNGTGSTNTGVYLSVGAQVSSTGIATVTLDGTGGNGADNNYGVVIEANQSTSTLVTSAVGDILLKGRGGNGSGRAQIGVWVIGGAQVTSTDVAKITLDGTAGAGTDTNIGVWVTNANSLVTSVAGDILIKGKGAGSTLSNYGVYISDGGQVRSTGAATVTVDGVGGSAGDSNHGVVLAGISYTNALVTSVDGDIAITGQGGAGSPTGINATFGIRMLLGAVVTSTGGADLVLSADTMNCTFPTSINVGANTVTLKPKTAGTAIDLGGADAVGTLGLTDAELDFITAGTLIIGDATSGPMTVSSDIARPAATDLRLVSGGDIVISGGQVNTVGGPLLLDPGPAPAALKPTRAGTDAVASTVSFSSALAISIAINGTIVDSQYTQLKLSGAVDLTGATLVLTGAYVPATDEVFVILSATSRTGQFIGLAENDEVTFNGKQLRVNYTDTSVTLRTAAEQPPTVADLQVSVSDGVTSTAPGSTLTYTFSYANMGGQSATGVSLTETLPTGTTFNAAASTAGWAETAPGSGVFKFTVGNLVGGASGSAMFVVTVNNPAAPGQTQIVNTASIADDGADDSDPTPSDNAVTDTNTLSAAPDLQISVSDGKTSANLGSTLTYTLTYANVGNQAATGVELTETLPTGTTFNAAASTAGWTETAPGSGIFKLTVGNLAGGGGSHTALFVVTVNNPASPEQTQIVNTASIAGDGENGEDPTPGNNTATDTDALRLLSTATDLRVRNIVSAPRVHADQRLTFTLVVHNLGSNPAAGVTLSSAMPGGARFVSFIAPRGWVVHRPAVGSRGTVTATRSSLAAGQVARFRLVVCVGHGARIGLPITDMVEIATTSVDTDSSNDRAMASARVLATRLTFILTGRSADYRSELGLFLVDDASGRIGRIHPGDAGYARAALSRTQFYFDRWAAMGSSHTLKLRPGKFYGWYLVQNSSSAQFLASNPGNRMGQGPLMFFSFQAANPDGFNHLRKLGPNQVGFEDQTYGGDQDFNDLIVNQVQR